MSPQSNRCADSLKHEPIHPHGVSQKFATYSIFIARKAAIASATPDSEFH